MARIAYFDCPSGAAGDMIMGALVDAGAPFEALRDGLHGLDLTGWDLVRHEVRRGGFRAPQGGGQNDAPPPPDPPPPRGIVALPGRSHPPPPVGGPARFVFRAPPGARA